MGRFEGTYLKLASYRDAYIAATRAVERAGSRVERKVFQAVTTEPELCFTEISARPAGMGTAASIESGELRIEIHAGADAETIRTIIQALKEC